MQGEDRSGGGEESVSGEIGGVTDANRGLAHRMQKGCDPVCCSTRRHLYLHHVYPYQEGGRTMFAGREGHRHQFIVMGHIEPD
jgi:hypothetical protein